MEAVILAAGEGVRMRPLTWTRPKVMLPVGNKPILEHLIANLKRAGVRDIVLVVGYRDDVIREYFGDGSGFGVAIRYVGQRKQLGTTDALRSALHLLGDRFLMLNGDAIVGAKDIERVILEDGMVLGVREVENPLDFGIVEVGAGLVRRIIEKPEKPPGNLINAGVYCFSSDIFEFLDATSLSRRGEYEVTDAIQLALDHGVVFKACDIMRWFDMGYPWNLLDANEMIVSEFERSVIEGEVEEGVVVKGGVVVGEGSVIRSGSYIIGPVVIGADCVVGPNCFIRPSTSIGDNCHIGAGVEVKNSIIMSDTKVPHLSYLGDSIVGYGCNLGAGTKIANLRLDGREIYMNVGGRRVFTGRRKFGAVLGDRVKTGINTTINVGSMIGNDVFTGPGAVVDDCVEPFTKVF